MIRLFDLLDVLVCGILLIIFFILWIPIAIVNLLLGRTFVLVRDRLKRTSPPTDI